MERSTKCNRHCFYILVSRETEASSIYKFMVHIVYFVGSFGDANYVVCHRSFLICVFLPVMDDTLVHQSMLSCLSCQTREFFSALLLGYGFIR